MLVDKAKIKVASGKGGNGASTFRREKFIAYGGPDGGDGGNGGNVYLEACKDMNTLLDFKYKSIYKADDGEKGARQNCHGRNGKDLTVKVPIGTVVSDENEGIVIADLTEDQERVLVAEGGHGGKGNAKFKTNKNRIPHFCEPGEPTIEREVTLELKMIADVGIIGFPNAGKSTLISQISAAKPKIADYAFTTLEPNLGVVRKPDGNGFVVADIPGLIEGASEGVGLGHEFLRHIERTRMLVHVVDVWGVDQNHEDYTETMEPIDCYHKLNLELEKYNDKLIKKSQVLVLNKIEGYPDEELQELVNKFQKVIIDQENKSDHPIKTIGFFQISAVTGEGTDELKAFLAEKVDEIEPEENEILIDFDPIATNHDDSNYVIEYQDPGKWVVHCGKLERLMKITDLRQAEALSHLFYVVKSMGVMDSLISKGAQIGQTLDIDGVEFELDEVNLVKNS